MFCDLLLLSERTGERWGEERRRPNRRQRSVGFGDEHIAEMRLSTVSHWRDRVLKAT